MPLVAVRFRTSVARVRERSARPARSCLEEDEAPARRSFEEEEAETAAVRARAWNRVTFAASETGSLAAAWPAAASRAPSGGTESGGASDEVRDASEAREVRDARLRAEEAAAEGRLPNVMVRAAWFAPEAAPPEARTTRLDDARRESAS